MASDPKTELCDAIRDKLLARFLERARDGVADSPEGHCADLADQVMDLFTVEEDCQSIDTSRLCEPDGSAMWHRRLIAATDWQPTDAPDSGTRQLMALLRANGIDLDTVLGHPGPEVDVVARTITVHHVIPGTLGAESLRRTYPMTVPPEELRR